MGATAKALEYIGIARMGGGVETGEENTKLLVKSGKAKLVIVASDASPAAKRRAEGYVYETKIPLVETPYTKQEICAISGRPGCSMAAFRDLGLSASFTAALHAEYGEAYREIAETLSLRQRRAKERKTGKRRKQV